MGDPESCAKFTTPTEHLIFGPLGPSGVIPIYSFLFRIFNIPLNAYTPPRLVDPVIDLIPKYWTVFAMSCPSRCLEMSI